MRYPYFDFMAMPGDLPTGAECSKCGAKGVLLLNLGGRLVCLTCANGEAKVIEPPGSPGAKGARSL